MKKSREVKDIYLDKKHLEYHLKQFQEPYRSTVHLCNFIARFLDVNASYNAIDVGCGAGANIYHLSKILRNTSWVGLDWADYLFSLKEDTMKDVKCSFIKGDFYNLDEMFNSKSFDLVFSIQTLSWLPEYEEVLEKLIKIANKYVFITSLFTDFHVDVFSQVVTYEDDFKPKDPYFYNIYNFDRFEKFCLNLGVKEVIAEDFIIDIDLEKPKEPNMGTYTLKTAKNYNLQFSGPLNLPWKFIALKI